MYKHVVTVTLVSQRD